MLVVDTSAWIEFLRGRETGSRLAREFPPHAQCFVPTIVQFELAKWLDREAPEDVADAILVETNFCQVVPLTTQLAIAAATVSREHKLPMADAIIYATALAHDAELLTCDSHFEGLPGVRYLAKTGV